MRKIRGKFGSQSEARRARRKLVIRKIVSGTSERPRICINKTNKHLLVQVVDDVAKATLFTVKTFGETAVSDAKNNKDGAKKVGLAVAVELKKRSVQSAVFDRSGYRYHGVVAAVADGIRESGVRI